MKKYVIFNYEETAINWQSTIFEPMFWSNADGWVDLSCATMFTEDEWKNATLPIVGVWVQLPNGFDE